MISGLAQSHIDALEELLDGRKSLDDLEVWLSANRYSEETLNQLATLGAVAFDDPDHVVITHKGLAILIAQLLTENRQLWNEVTTFRSVTKRNTAEVKQPVKPTGFFSALRR